MNAETEASLAEHVRFISEAISGSYPAGLDTEAHAWRRVMKVSEEVGEVTEALLGYLGENPRKGRTHTIEDLRTDYKLTEQEKALRDRLSSEDWMIVKAGFRRSYDQGREDATAETTPVGLDLNVLAQTNAERCRRWHPETSEPWSLADWSNAMCGEAGEAANMVKKLRRIETRTDEGPWSHTVHTTGREVPHDRDTQARILTKGIGLELADVVIYADLVAQELTRKYGGYPLSELIVTKFNAVSHREGYPERLSHPNLGLPAPGTVVRERVSPPGQTTAQAAVNEGADVSDGEGEGE